MFSNMMRVEGRSRFVLQVQNAYARKCEELMSQGSEEGIISEKIDQLKVLFTKNIFHHIFIKSYWRF